MEKQLFTLRVWQESLGQQRTEWRGEIKCLSSSEVRYFQDVHTLYAALQNLLRSSVQPNTPDRYTPPVGKF